MVYTLDKIPKVCYNLGTIKKGVDTMNKIETLMAKLKCTEAEARQILADDEAIDKGEKLFELSAEGKKVAKSMTIAGEKTVKKSVKRERKADDEKVAIIEKIADFLAKNKGFSVEILKKEKEISLKIGENDYSVTLTKHRPPKK